MLTVQKFISGKSLFQMNQKPACFTSPIVTHTKRITFESKTARNKRTTFQLRTYVHLTRAGRVTSYNLTKRQRIKAFVEH